MLELQYPSQHSQPSQPTTRANSQSSSVGEVEVEEEEVVVDSRGGTSGGKSGGKSGSGDKHVLDVSGPLTKRARNSTTDHTNTNTRDRLTNNTNNSRHSKHTTHTKHTKHTTYNSDSDQGSDQGSDEEVDLLHRLRASTNYNNDTNTNADTNANGDGGDSLSGSSLEENEVVAA